MPERRLHSFHVPRPPDIPIEDPNQIVAQLEEWIKDNPNHPLVDKDWQTIPSEQAANHIHELATEGYNVKLEETWLEGGPALRVWADSYD